MLYVGIHLPDHEMKMFWSRFCHLKIMAAIVLFPQQAPELDM